MMRQRGAASATTTTTTVDPPSAIVDVEGGPPSSAAAAAAAVGAGAPPPSAAPGWYSPNPVAGADAGSGGGLAATLTPLEREPAPYSMHTGSGSAEPSWETPAFKAGRDRRQAAAGGRLSVWDLVRAILCAVGLLCVLGASAGLRPTLNEPAGSAASSSASAESDASALELAACRRTLANLRTRVAGLEQPPAAAPSAAPAAAAAEASAKLQQSAAAGLLLAKGDNDAAYALMATQLSSIQAELRLTKMASWEPVSSSSAAAEEEAHALLTVGGEPAASASKCIARRIAVRSAFLRAYGAYESYAFGFDDLKPLRQKGEDWLGAKMMNYVAKMMNYVAKTMISVLKTMVFVLNTMIFALRDGRDDC